MRSGVAVCDASPLIVLHQIGKLTLLHELFARTIVPITVAREVAPSLGALPPWLDVGEIPAIPAFSRKLDEGERDAIALAMHLSADFVVLDDRAGRRTAAELELTEIGSLGLLVRAKRSGLILRVQPIMDAMIANGLYATPRLYHVILTASGEAD